MKRILIVFFLVMAITLPERGFLFAETNANQEIDTINQEIQSKKNALGDVNRRIADLEGQVKILGKKAKSLETEAAIISNRIAKITLDAEATQLQIETATSEVALLDRQIGDVETKLDQQREVMRTALREIQQADSRSKLLAVFGTQTFSQFFERLRFFERVNRQLDKAVASTKDLQSALAQQRSQKEEKLTSVRTLALRLADEQDQLENQKTAKVVLATQTRDSESEYQVLVNELVREQAGIQNQIVALQDDIDRKLKAGDSGESGSLSAFSWPLNTSVKRVTTLFHDPTYPFRYLFEHSGLDIAAPVGTPVLSPAPGYVAWTRQGQMYGNYMMVIHTDGVATLYAHLTSFTAKTDQYVARGQQIATTGGCRGCAGAGFSTGPHLHFEVRKNGIPVNPLTYVIRP